MKRRGGWIYYADFKASEAGGGGGGGHIYVSRTSIEDLSSPDQRIVVVSQEPLSISLTFSTPHFEVFQTRSSQDLDGAAAIPRLRKAGQPGARILGLAASIQGLRAFLAELPAAFRRALKRGQQ